MFRLIRAVLERPWAPKTFGIGALLFFGGALIARVEGSSVYVTFLEWGATSTVIALGAWAFNRD